MIPADQPDAATDLPNLLADFLIALAGDDYADVLRQRERVFGRITGEPGNLAALRCAVGMAASAFSMRSRCSDDGADWRSVVTSLEAAIENELASLLRRAG